MPRRPLIPTPAPERPLAEVRALPADRFPITSAATRTRFCGHKHQTIDLDKREVRCATCLKLLDPYEVLDKLASEGAWVVSLRLERMRLAEEIAKLKEQRTATRAALRRVGAASRKP